MKWLIGKKVASLGGSTPMCAVPSGQPVYVGAVGCGYASLLNPTRMPRESGSVPHSPARLFDSEGFRSPQNGKEGIDLGSLSISCAAEVPSVSEMAGLHAKFSVDAALSKNKPKGVRGSAFPFLPTCPLALTSFLMKGSALAKNELLETPASSGRLC